jgi:hypothetical protein
LVAAFQEFEGLRWEVVDYSLRGRGVGLVDMHALDRTAECDLLGLILYAGAGISRFAPDGVLVTG